MTYFADGTPYTYLPSSNEIALNVGWLSASHPFPVGSTPSELVPTILRMVRKEVVNRTRGWHRCELCADPAYPIRMDVDGESVTLGDAEIRVSSEDGTVYAAPTLIAHYIEAHSYAPPQKFVRAVLDKSP